MEEKPTCPLCGNRLYPRVTADGYVCKNWRCDAFWKLQKGAVFDGDANYKYFQGNTSKELSIFEDL